MDLKLIKKFDEHTTRFWNSQGAKVDTIHILLGLSTEIAEIQDNIKKHIGYGKPIDRTNILEECGDLLYFSFRLLHLTQKENNDFKFLIKSQLNNFENPLIELLNCTQDVISMLFLLQECIVKLYYDISRAQLENSVCQNLCISETVLKILGVTKKILNFYEFTLEDAVEANIRKLEVRYPDKAFNLSNALNRNLDVENEALAGKMSIDN